MGIVMAPVVGNRTADRRHVRLVFLRRAAMGIVMVTGGSGFIASIGPYLSSRGRMTRATLSVCPTAEGFCAAYLARRGYNGSTFPSRFSPAMTNRVAKAQSAGSRLSSAQACSV